MKHFKKFFSYLVALTMVLSLAAFTGVKVHAEGKYTLTINNTSAGHILNMYQILTGDVYEKKLSNAKWGNGVSSIKFSDTETKKITDSDVGKPVDEATMGKFANLTDLEKSIIVNENNVYKTSTVSNDSKPVEFKDVKGGYYVVTDTVPTSTATTGDATAKKHTVTYSIVQVVGPTTVNEKAGTIQSEKKVEDVNDSTGTITSGQSANNLLSKDELGDSADYDIGDKINYTIEAKLPENYADYDTFPLTFVDTMSKGLTYVANSATLHLSGNNTKPLEPTNKNVNYTDPDNSNAEDKSATQYKWAIDNLKELDSNLKARDVVYITYSATLNSEAVVGSEGNPNKMHIEFNSNPYSNTPETKTTPDDTNIVFTYEAVFNKVDQDNKPLTGADFTLYKFVKSEKGADTYQGEKGTWTDVTKLRNDGNNPEKNVSEYSKGKDNAARAKFSFKGIDDGYYKLVESTTPDGYNTMEDKYFTITATHDIIADQPTLKTLTAKIEAEDLTLNGENGVLTTEIENKEGSKLPSTGGMGTTLLYVAGGILVACAAAYVVMSRKHSTNK